MCLLAQVQKEILLDYKGNKELSQYALGAMHTIFPITSTCVIVSKVPTGEDGEVIEPNIFT